MEYDPRDGLEKRGLQKRKPDRVFGLAKTKSLDYYSKASLVKGLRHSPFPGADMLYPFLILEAKSEGRGPGFESIETQTAFPIRTCVKLQNDLRRQSGVSLDPLLWFMSYEGDEWRVAACIMHDEEFVSLSREPSAAIEDLMIISKQVIDLWMGRATSRDGALQLLHIIDFICNWARDVFRLEILHCLAGGRENFRLASPTYASRFSTQEPRHESPMGNQGDPGAHANTDADSDADTVGLTETSSLRNLMLDDAIMEDQPAPVGDEGVESYENTTSHPLLRWVNASPYQAPWTRHATIRHSNMSLFMFSHLPLPEDSDTLVEFLQQVSGMRAGSIGDIALGLISSFLDCTSAMTTTSNRILQLRNEWLKEGSGVAAGSESPVRALFSFRTYVRTFDWQIVRELWCISCTLQAAQRLATIAGVDFEVPRAPTRWSTDMHLFPSSIFNSLHSLTRKDSATAAINSTVLYLAIHEREKGQYRCQWISSDASESTMKSFSLLSPSVCCRGTLASLMDNGTALMEVLEKPLPKDLKHCLGPQLSASQGAILLCKGRHWPEIAPRWCLMVLNELDFEDNRELGRSLIQAKDKGDYYTFAFASWHDKAGEPTKELIDHSVDGRFLDRWIDHLSS